MYGKNIHVYEYFFHFSFLSGPFLVLALAREDAIEGWRQLLGPKKVEEAKEEAPESLRSQYSVEDVEINPLHGSSDPEEACKEVEYFFPTEQTVAVIKPNALSDKGVPHTFTL